MTSCWRGSRPCFMLSTLVYLALPIPCDADHPICVPPQVGDSWTYWRETIDYRGDWTEIDTVTASFVGTEQVGDQEYYRLNNGERYRASADGAIWRYGNLYYDLWRVGADQEGEIRYEGVLFGISTEHDGGDESERGHKLVRRGPLEIAVGDSLYSGVFEFWIEEGGLRYCCSEFYVTLYVHPEIGAVKMTIDTSEYHDTWELLSYSRQSGESDVPSVVREVTWGTVKKRHMPKRSR